MSVFFATTTTTAARLVAVRGGRGRSSHVAMRKAAAIAIVSDDGDDDEDDDARQRRRDGFRLLPDSTTTTIATIALVRDRPRRPSSVVVVAAPPRRNGGGVGGGSHLLGDGDRLLRPCEGTTATSQRRGYRASPRREILPLVAVGVVALTVRYSWKALRRMDEEWEEYERLLKEHESAVGRVGSEGGGGEGRRRGGTTTEAFKDGVMGVDLGTVNVRIAFRSRKDSKPRIVVDREGGRSTPNVVLYHDNVAEATLGRLARGKEFESRGLVRNPYTMLSNGEEGAGVAVGKVLRDVMANALEQELGPPPAASSGDAGESRPLFAAAPLAAGGGTYGVLPSFVRPPRNQSHSDRYREAASTLTSPSNIGSFVKEPVAALLGAEEFGLLPSSSSDGGGKPSMVIDVGGLSTAVSIVSIDETVTHSVVVSMGGEDLISLLANHAVQTFYGPNETLETLNDPLAVQRLHDACRESSIELSSKTRTNVNVPYLTVDEDMVPKHLDLDVSRAVLKHKLDSFVNDGLDAIVVGGKTNDGGKEEAKLSNSLPRPTDLESLLSSVIARTLESSSTNPFDLRCVLIVGGGSRSPIMKDALKRGIGRLAGSSYVDERVIFPVGNLAEELVVLGATTTRTAWDDN